VYSADSEAHKLYQCKSNTSGVGLVVTTESGM